MPLNNIQRNPQLLDTLLALNTLVGSLSKSDLKNTIGEIKDGLTALKEEQGALKTLKKDNEKELVELAKAAEEYERSALIAETTDKSLDKKNIELGERIKLVKKETDLLKAEKKELELAVKKHEGGVSVKERELSERDKVLVTSQKEAEELKLEYETKLADLKKITG